MAAAICTKHNNMLPLTALFLLLVNISSAFDPLRTKGKVWTHFDFIIPLAPRQRECYHQYAESGMVFAISYKVVYGEQSDQNFGFSVTDSTGNIINRNYQQNEDSVQLKVKESGVYTICMGNEATRFYSKKVHIYIDLFDKQRFESVIEEENKFDNSLGNITKTIRILNEGIREMRMYQMKTRQHVTNDWYILSANLAYVNRWSLVQCVVIIGCGILQVYVLRTFFNVPTNTRKPRC
ncbi:transmembrane emp24 domain-containing protein 6-like [Anneissia japonica]|uniref:transmembrane emp24 domain-containing protein 6-like n=1 Tax=Anneissia japonica TaxID=1529436 RepID=UPI001425B5B5|nr:transmembrane emp24 domain-containing protein 6-like [Anneissia japonica]